MGRPYSDGRLRQLDDVASALPQRSSALTRLFLSRTTVGISRTEAGIMHALALKPQRITELAGCEGVTQPAITSVVNRLEERGWVERGADASDGRAVLVRLSADGRDVFERLRVEYRAMLHEEMEALDDDDLATLARAVEILDRLIEHLRGHGD